MSLGPDAGSARRRAPRIFAAAIFPFYFYGIILPPIEKECWEQTVVAATEFLLLGRSPTPRASPVARILMTRKTHLEFRAYTLSKSEFRTLHT
jgi:hypothetical protein